MRAVPRERELHPDQREYLLRWLPPERFPGNYDSESRDVRVLADLPAVPQHDLLDQRDFRSLDHRIPADRLPYQRAVRAVPREQQLQPDQREYGLRELPPEGFPGNYESESRHFRLPADLPAVPQHHQLDQRDFRSLDHWIPADRLPYQRAVHPLPREQQLQPDQREHGLRELPPEGFPRHDESQSRAVEFPADLPAVPYHYLMGECDLRPLDHGIPADRRAYGAAVHPVPREWEL